MDEINQLKNVVQNDIEFQDTVSFNWPKYEEAGTPYNIWFENTNAVEESLIKILEAQPFPDEYPLVYIKREDTNSEGVVTNVHLDVYGRTTLVKFALTMLDPFVQNYVSKNIVSTPAGAEALQNFEAKAKELGVIPELIKADPNDLIGSVKKQLKEKGLDPDKVLITTMDGKTVDLGTKEEEEELFDDGSPPMILMPNPDPDGYN